MKYFNSFCIIAFFFLTTASGIGASERGTTSADFLKIGLGAGAAGMGEAYTAHYGDVNSMFYNPAGLTGLEMNMFSATHLNWIAETQYEAIAYAWPMVGVGTLGFNFFLLHMPEIPALDVNGTPNGMLQAFDLGAQFSYARDISPFVGLKGLNAGAGLKVLHRELAGTNASGVALDIGGLYQLNANACFGLSLLNLGYLSSFDSAAEQLPLIARAGAGYLLEIVADHQLWLLLDLVQPFDNTFRANVGCEYSFARIVSLRLGYKLGYDTDGFQAGAGVKWRNFSVDYAIKLMGVFGVTHFVSAAIGFGTPMKTLQKDEVKKILKQAEELYSQSKYAEALKIVKQAILIDANNRRALQLQDKLRTVLQMLEMPVEEEQEQKPEHDSQTEELTPDELEELGVPVNQEVQQ